MHAKTHVENLFTVMRHKPCSNPRGGRLLRFLHQKVVSTLRWCCPSSHQCKILLERN